MYESFFKRLMDFVVSIVGLLFLSPLLCAVAATIYVTDGAPVLFRQQRVGRRRKLLNVLKGDKSFIGPRLEIAEWAKYPEDWDIVLSVRPGITDWASILYRHEEEILAESSVTQKTYSNEIQPGKLELYNSYVSDLRFGNDMVILIKNLGSLGCRAS